MLGTLNKIRPYTFSASEAFEEGAQFSIGVGVNDYYNKNIREITSDMTIRKGPKGDYIFYKTTKMKKPKFFDLKNFNSDIKEDYKICDINILRSWIREKYNV